MVTRNNRYLSYNWKRPNRKSELEQLQTEKSLKFICDKPLIQRAGSSYMDHSSKSCGIFGSLWIASHGLGHGNPQSTMQGSQLNLQNVYMMAANSVMSAREVIIGGLQLDGSSINTYQMNEQVTNKDMEFLTPQAHFLLQAHLNLMVYIWTTRFRTKL